MSPLTSYAYVMGLAVDTGAEQYASIRSALAAPGPVQPLLLGLAEALPVLRGERNVLQPEEVWALVACSSLGLRVLGLEAAGVAQRMLSSRARPGGPVLMELVRDVAAALPRSPPAYLPLRNFLPTHAFLCDTLGLLTPAAAAAGSSGAMAALWAEAGWAAMEAFVTLGPAIRSLVAPPSQFDTELLRVAATAPYYAVGGLIQLLQGWPSSCSRQQLQLLSDVAWEAVNQVPLLVAFAAREPGAPSGKGSKLAAMFMAALDALIANAQQVAAPAPRSVVRSRQPPSANADAAAAAAATQLLEQAHHRLCKMVHYLVASVPPEQRPVQAALVGPEAKRPLAGLLAQCFDALQLAWSCSEGSGSRQAEGSSAEEEHDR